MSFHESSEADAVLVIHRASPLPWLLVLLLGVGGGAAVYWLYGRMQAQDADLAAAHAREAQLKEKGNQQSSAATELTVELDRLKAENAELSGAKDALSKDVAAKSDELAKLQGTYVALQEKMKVEIAKGDIRLTQLGGKVQVDLVDKVLFDSGEAQISPRGQEVLQRVGAVLGTLDDKQIQVSGHTDDSPISAKLLAQFPTNWELSSARAINVVRFLTEKAHLPGRRLVATGFGQFHPVGSNATPIGRARNRRIEILLTPLLVTSSPKQAKPEAKAPAAASKVGPRVPKATLQR